MKEFLEDINKFHDMYGLVKPGVPNLNAVGDYQHRMEQFQVILSKEMQEGDDILKTMHTVGHREIDVLVELADWFGDIIVYCASEARRYGIPIDKVLTVIMQSNFSKLGADGLPIISEGKVQKGPNYWKPEPKIKELLLLEYHKPE